MTIINGETIMVAAFGLLKYELHHILLEPSKVKPFVIEKLFCASFDFYLSCLVYCWVGDIYGEMLSICWCLVVLVKWKMSLKHCKLRFLY